MAVSQGRDNYARMHAGFRWQVPRAVQHRAGLLRALGAAAGRRCSASRSARTRRRADARLSLCASCRRAANRAAATCCSALGVQRGDRVAIVMPQRFETAVAYMAVFQLGAVAMPLSMLFGPDALEYRMQRQRGRGWRSSTRARSPTCSRCAPHCPALRTVIGVGAAEAQARPRLGARARRGSRPTSTPVADAGRRRRGADLHQRHDRPAQGRADPAPRADRQPAAASSAARTGSASTASRQRPRACSGRPPTGPGPAA